MAGMNSFFWIFWSALINIACVKWCFWVTPPVGLAGFAVVLFLLPLKKVEGDMKGFAHCSVVSVQFANLFFLVRKLKVIDVLGAVLSLGGGTMLVLPLVWVCTN